MNAGLFVGWGVDGSVFIVPRGNVSGVVGVAGVGDPRGIGATTLGVDGSKGGVNAVGVALVGQPSVAIVSLGGGARACERHVPQLPS